MTRARVVLVVAALVASALVSSVRVHAADPNDEHERAMVDALRREDPAAADRYVALRDAREQALAEVKRVETLYNAAAPEARVLFVPQVRQARRRYAETSLALIDFFDERDRRALASYQEEITRINERLEGRRRTRAELEKLLQ